MKKQLVQILTTHTPPGFEIHAVFPAGAALAAKTRVFIDLLSAWVQKHAGRFDA